MVCVFLCLRDGVLCVYQYTSVSKTQPNTWDVTFCVKSWRFSAVNHLCKKRYISDAWLGSEYVYPVSPVYGQTFNIYGIQI